MCVQTGRFVYSWCAFLFQLAMYLEFGLSRHKTAMCCEAPSKCGWDCCVQLVVGLAIF